MPLLLLRGCPLVLSDAERLKHSYCTEVAVQSLNTSQIDDLMCGRRCKELSYLCWSVTNLEYHGGPMWLAAVTPHNHLCSSDETILVPLSLNIVRTALLDALMQRTGLPFPEAGVLRKLIAAQSCGRVEELVSVHALGLRPPQSVPCQRTCAALLSAHVPCSSQSTSATAKRGQSSLAQCFEFNKLSEDVQMLIIFLCVCEPEGVHMSALALVNKLFASVVWRSKTAFAELLRAAVQQGDAHGMAGWARAVAHRGMYPSKVMKLSSSKVIRTS